jgi:hypothetical protein
LGVVLDGVGFGELVVGDGLGLVDDVVGVGSGRGAGVGAVTGDRIGKGTTGVPSRAEAM